MTAPCPTGPHPVDTAAWERVRAGVDRLRPCATCGEPTDAKWCSDYCFDERNDHRETVS